jgi:hypothetical protein
MHRKFEFDSVSGTVRLSNPTSIGKGKLLEIRSSKGLQGDLCCQIELLHIRTREMAHVS